jgi:hypothetical protein
MSALMSNTQVEDWAKQPSCRLGYVPLAEGDQPHNSQALMVVPRGVAVTMTHQAHTDACPSVSSQPPRLAACI